MIPSNNNDTGPTICPPVVWLTVDFSSPYPITAGDLDDTQRICDVYLKELRKRFVINK